MAGRSKSRNPGSIEPLAQLSAAAKKKDFTAIRRILDESPSLRADDPTMQAAFVTSAFSQDASLIKAFVERGLDINIRVGSHRILVLAAGCPSAEYFDELLKLGADVNLPGWDNMTPLIMAAITAGKVSDPEVLFERIKTLVARGADINATDVVGKTALDFAFRQQSVTVVEFLLSLNANLKTCSGGGRDCLWHASMSLDDRLLELALKAGADPTWDVLSTPAVQYAAEEGAESKVRMLIEFGAPSILNDGRTALEVAREGSEKKRELRDLVDDLMPKYQYFLDRLGALSKEFPDLNPGSVHRGEYLLGKHLCLYASNLSLVLCLGGKGTRAALKEPGVSAYEQRKGKVLEGWVQVSPDQIREDSQLRAWMKRAVDHGYVLRERKRELREKKKGRQSR